MRKYSDITALQDAIRNNDVSSIKEELIRSVIVLKGNREELNRAIGDILGKTSFNFDAHQAISYVSQDPKDLYAEVSRVLEDNFSKQRFQELIDIYHRAYTNRKKENEVVERYRAIPDKPKNMHQSAENHNYKNIEKVVVTAAATAAAVATISYVISKILK